MRISDWSSDVCSSDLPRVSARTNPFRRNRNIAPLGPESAQRQGAISALAFQLLGGRDAALDFLNIENRPLGGRQIAVRSEQRPEGTECVSKCRSRGSPYL